MVRDLKQEMFNVMEVLRDWYPGKYVKEVEEKLSLMHDGHFVVSVNSGTSALLTALAGVGVRPGDNVITPASTFAAPAFAVKQIGAVPTFADIDIDTWNVTVDTIEPLINDYTTAVIVVHLYGLPADIHAIREMCDYYEIKLIEDCAEAFLADIAGQPVGTIGDASIFSFEKSKHITCGSGGAVLFKRDDHARRGRKFSILGYSNLTATGSRGTKNDVQHPDFNRHYTMGFNFRLPELCAAVLSAQLDKAEELVNMRVRAAEIFKQVTDRYMSIGTQQVRDHYRHTYWTFAFTLPPHYMGREEQVKLYEEFRRLFIQDGGDAFFAGWKPVPEEPFFVKGGYVGLFDQAAVAHMIQPRLVCLNTGVDEKKAQEQADILDNTISKIKVRDI